MIKQQFLSNNENNKDNASSEIYDKTITILKNDNTSMSELIAQL